MLNEWQMAIVLVLTGGEWSDSNVIRMSRSAIWQAHTNISEGHIISIFTNTTGEGVGK